MGKGRGLEGAEERTMGIIMVKICYIKNNNTYQNFILRGHRRGLRKGSWKRLEGGRGK